VGGERRVERGEKAVFSQFCIDYHISSLGLKEETQGIQEVEWDFQVAEMR
jgi:hypothetical protein